MYDAFGRGRESEWAEWCFRNNHWESRTPDMHRSYPYRGETCLFVYRFCHHFSFSFEMTCLGSSNRRYYHFTSLNGCQWQHTSSTDNSACVSTSVFDSTYKLSFPKKTKKMHSFNDTQKPNSNYSCCIPVSAAIILCKEIIIISHYLQSDRLFIFLSTKRKKIN